MTTNLTPDAVAAMEGRELDVLVAEHVCGYTAIGQMASCDLATGDMNDSDDDDWVGVPPNGLKDYFAGNRKASFDFLPRYSTSEGSSFFAMVRAVSDKWNVRISRTLDGKCRVLLWRIDEQHGADGHTLPLAFARAAVLTTLDTNGGT